MAKDKVKLEDFLNLVKKGEYKTLIDQVAITQDYISMINLMKSKEITAVDVETMIELIIKLYEESNNESMQDAYIGVLDMVTTSSKIDTNTLERLCDFAIQNKYSKSLWNIAKHESLTHNAAKKICEYRKDTNEYNMTVTMELLSDNENTPDDILFYIVEEDHSASVRKIANEKLAVRYKLLREKLQRSKYGRNFLNS